jgi:CheY-like chemotaxis protein
MIQIAAPRILVIEDDDGAREALESLLVEDGYAVCSAGTGLAGIQCAREFRPQVIVCDFALPDIDGLEVMRRLRAYLGDVFIVLVTAGGFGPLGERALRAEADVFLDKPVDLDLLRGTLSRATHPFDGGPQRQGSSTWPITTTSPTS